jgi:hypothetical protein
MPESTTNINMPSVPLGEFYEMKGQLNGQDRELKALREEVAEVKKDIRTLLEAVNRGKGGLWAAITIGSLIGGVITLLGEFFLRGH